jgi:hypothetical protein
VTALLLFLVKRMGDFTPLPALAVGMLSMLSVVLALSFGFIQSNERSIFTAVILVVTLTVAATLLSIASGEHEPDECVWSED